MVEVTESVAVQTVSCLAAALAVLSASCNHSMQTHLPTDCRREVEGIMTGSKRLVHVATAPCNSSVSSLLMTLKGTPL